MVTNNMQRDRLNGEHIRKALQELFEAKSQQEINNRAKNLTGFLYSSEILHRWAGAITKRVGWGPEKSEETLQTIAERFLFHTQNRTERLQKVVQTNRDVTAGVFQILSSEMFTESRSSTSTGITGMSGALRRADRFKKFERDLSQELGRTPSTEEVVAAANEAASHRNAARQGILLDGNNHNVGVVNQGDSQQRALGDAGVDPSLMHDFIDVVRQISTTLMVMYPQDMPDVVSTLKRWFWAHKEGAIAVGEDEHFELAAYAGIDVETAQRHLGMIYAARDKFLAEQRPFSPAA